MHWTAASKSALWPAHRRVSLGAINARPSGSNEQLHRDEDFTCTPAPDHQPISSILAMFSGRVMAALRAHWKWHHYRYRHIEYWRAGSEALKAARLHFIIEISSNDAI